MYINRVGYKNTIHTKVFCSGVNSDLGIKNPTSMIDEFNNFICHGGGIVSVIFYNKVGCAYIYANHHGGGKSLFS